MQGLGRHHRAVSLALTGLQLAVGLTAAPGPTRVSFPTSDGGRVHADLYGAGLDAVVLAHGAVFDKESWAPLARVLAQEGFLVLALDFRGYGESKPGTDKMALHLDVLAALDYLEERGANRLSVVGASLGANAVGRVASESRPGRLSTVILLAPARLPEPQAMKAERFVFIVSEDEPAIDRIRRIYDQAPDPKRLELLATDAHAQHVFKTDQGPNLTALIVAGLRQ